MKKQGIIFDMDGTLWDSAENVAKSWNKAIADYGYERAPITKEDMYSVCLLYTSPSPRDA